MTEKALTAEAELQQVKANLEAQLKNQIILQVPK
jgi:hypothetical protein